MKMHRHGKRTEILHVEDNLIILLQSQFRTGELAIGQNHLSGNSCNGPVGPGQGDGEVNSRSGDPLHKAKKENRPVSSGELHIDRYRKVATQYKRVESSKCDGMASWAPALVKYKNVVISIIHLDPKISILAGVLTQTPY